MNGSKDEIDRDELEEYLAKLRVSRSMLVTAHARIDQATAGIEDLLDEMPENDEE